MYVCISDVRYLLDLNTNKGNFSHKKRVNHDPFFVKHNTYCIVQAGLTYVPKYKST